MTPSSRLLLLLLAVLTVAPPLLAAQPMAIQDNSFLIEEAYNQEPRVVQNIFNFTRARDGAFLATFTQEWPAPGIRNQLSYTLPVQRLGRGEPHGLGDALINYRYQLVGDGNARLAVAPRLSLILPTGSARRGLGSGGYGFDTNIPLSLVITDRFVTHWNAGATKVPSSTDPITWSAGASAIVAARPKLHLMIESRWTHNGHSVVTVSPGVRWAYDFEKSGLQIVPGLAVPIGSDHTRAVFAYLSFEHPF